MVIAVRPETLDEYKRPRTARISQGAPSVATSASFTLRNAAFQRMMYDAGKYRLMMKAKDAVATRPVPPVQRPGVARTAAEREHADVRTLSARLATSGTIKDAVAFYNARRSSKR